MKFNRLPPFLFGLAASVSCAAVVAVFAFLFYFSAPVFSIQGMDRVFSWTWHPFGGLFGILPMIIGTICLAGTAMCLAYPLAVGICCFLHGLGPGYLRRPVLILVEFMTSIPTVVYGFVAVFLLVPYIRRAFEHGTGYSWLAASLMLALLILPTMVLMLHNQFRIVEPEVRTTALALGMNHVEKFVYVVFPQSGKGFLSAAVLGFGRAVGDTLLPLMLAGNAVESPASPLDSIRTLTSHIALVVATDSQSGAYHSLFVCGMLLFLASFGVNAALHWIAASGKEGTSHV
jgi:phosphate transport system permease protein